MKKATFTDKNGVKHTVRSGAFNPISGTFFYRPAMNFSLSLGFGLLTKSGQGGFEDVAPDGYNYGRNGWNWNIGFDYMF